MRKKLFSVFIGLVMTIALSACGIETTSVTPSQTVKTSHDVGSYNTPTSNGVSSGKTTSQQNAVELAQDYLHTSAFSRKGLIDQLEFEGFSTQDATYGADHCGADWNEQAVKCAENYLDTSPFSKQGLIDQLEYEGFTSEQAAYGVNATGLGSGSTSSNSTSEISLSKENALRAAKGYLKSGAFSEQSLLEQLEYEDYSTEDATYAVDHCGADWNEQAAKCAKSYLHSGAFSRSELIEQLEYEGFTSEQAVYGADAAGL